MDFEIPTWLIIAGAIIYFAWPIILIAGGTAIGALIAAAAAKSALALKVAGIAGAVFFSPIIIGVTGSCIISICNAVSSSTGNVFGKFADWNSNTTLINAVAKQNEKKVIKLIQKGADPNKLSKDLERFPLYESCRQYEDEAKADRITEQLLLAGADANKRLKFCNDSMEEAVYSSRLGAIRLLCEHGYELKGKDGRGNGIVEFAVKNLKIKEALTLLECGALPAKSYKFGICLDDYTSFMYVFEEPRFNDANISELEELFTKLLEKGADVNAVTTEQDDATALLIYARFSGTDKQNMLPLVRILLDAGANPNAVDREGKTALLHLARNAWDQELSYTRDTIKLFLSYGADNSLRDKDGKTAIEYFHEFCKRSKCKEADLPVYDEIESLLSPVTKAVKAVPANVAPFAFTDIAKITAESTKVAKTTDASKKKPSTLLALGKLDAPSAQSAHTMLDDMKDNW